jgi:hypothetical protein
MHGYPQKTIADWCGEKAHICGNSPTASRQHFAIWQFATNAPGGRNHSVKQRSAARRKELVGALSLNTRLEKRRPKRGAGQQKLLNWPALLLQWNGMTTGSKMTIDEAGARGGRSKSPLKMAASARNLERAKKVLAEKRALKVKK